MDKSIKLIAEDIASVLNGIIENTRCFTGHVSGQEIVDMSTEDEIMFFYLKICIRK